jgi:hypothetical protein
MDEERYNFLLSNYRRGTEFVISYKDNKNGITSRGIWIDEVSNNKGKKEPAFRFRDSGNILDVKAIRGFEKILDIVEPLHQLY